MAHFRLRRCDGWRSSSTCWTGLTRSSSSLLATAMSPHVSFAVQLTRASVRRLRGQCALRNCSYRKVNAAIVDLCTASAQELHTVGGSRIAIESQERQRRQHTAKFVFGRLFDIHWLRADNFCLLKPSICPTLQRRSVLALRLDAALSEWVSDHRHGACG